MRRIMPAIIGILLLWGGFSPAYGSGDADSFMVRADPNILILFDNSGSMRTIIFHSGYNSSTVYSGGFTSDAIYQVTSSGNYTYNSRTAYLRGGDADPLSSGTDYVRYPGNYLNWIFWQATVAERSSLPTTTRIEVAKQVITNYINSASSVRLGLMRFNYDAYDGGGTIVSAIDDLTASYKTSLINSLNAVAPDTNTPLAGSLSEAWRYFRGDSKCYGGSGNYQSPIQYECQKNFVVIITDGEPWADRMSKSCAASMKGNWDGDSEVEEPTSGWYSYLYLDDIAYYMYNNDARSSLDDTQNVYTYTIGFTIQSQLLQDTATNGHGLYLTSDNASQLAAALDSAIADIIEKSYSFTSPTVPSLMTSGGDVLYQASFEPSDAAFWKGHLYAYSIDSAGNITGTLWDAGTVLRDRAASTRTIYTVKNNALVAFNNTNLTAADLSVANDTERDKLINYVRGIDSYDDDGDGDTTEERSWKLGDIFHSGPVIVGAPKKFYFDYGYSGTGEFYETYKNRTKIILAGANDGMLHAFQASDGYELWAFIPPNLLSQLKYMRIAHTFFVDLPVRVEDVWFGTGDGTGAIATSKTACEWHTIAVVGERQGGDQFNALDITNTTSPSWLWSFNTSGETWGRPAVNRVNISGNEVWVVIMSGGYDSAGINGKAIYIVNAQNGANIWSYTSMGHSAPAPPYAVDINFDSFIDRIYLGDLGGDMYRFSVHDSNTANWFASKLFDAPSGQIRPIYTEAVGSFDTLNNLWIYFGTGDKSDPTAPNAQEKLFAIKEGCLYDAASCSSYSLSDLTNYTVQSGEVTNQGWYINMTGQGEKILSPPTVFGGVVYFTTYTPSQSSNPCDAGGGSTLYAVGYTTAAGQLGGESRTLSLGDGMSSAPIVSVRRDSVTGQLSGSIFVNTSTGGLQNLNVIPNVPSSLVDYIYWRDMRVR
ncbi:MAG: PilC/PilY family type IV pilus protein [Thermodesulfobacteriota bacterium]